MTITRPNLTDNDTLTAAQANALLVQTVTIDDREVTAAKLPAFNPGKLLGRVTAGAGDVEEVDASAAGLALLAASNAATQRALLNVGTLGQQAATAIDATGGKVAVESYRAKPDVLTYASTVALNFADSQCCVQSIGLTGTLTLTSANLANGACKLIRLINGSGGTAPLNLPAGWVCVDTAKPTSIATGKRAMLALWAFGTTDADVIMKYSVEP